jgi:hypothetical protein
MRFWLTSLPPIFGRVANPVEPFGFTLVPDRLEPALPAGMGDDFWNQANPIDQPAQGQAKSFYHVQSDFPTPYDRRPRCR